MSVSFILSIIVVCLILIIGMIIFVILERLMLKLVSAYNQTRIAFFEDLVLQALFDLEGGQRLHAIARCVYARWRCGRPGLRRFDIWSLDRSLLETAAELRGSDRQILVAVFEDAGGLARELRNLRALWWHKRLAAVHKLRIMHSRRAVPDLIRALNDRNRTVRNAALRALGELGDERAFPFLLKALEDQTRWSTLWAAHSVLAAGPAIVPPMHERLTSLRDPQLRALYLCLVSLLGDPSATDQLFTGLQMLSERAHGLS